MAGRAHDFFNGTGNFSKKFDEWQSELVVTNDGAADLTFTAGVSIFTLKPGEVFDEKIYNFDSIKIETSSSFRGFVRGDE